MENLYELIQDTMRTDDQCHKKISRILTKYYTELAVDTEKSAIDKAFIALMGYGLGTLIKKLEPQKPESITIDIVGYHPNDENGEVDESQMVYDFEEMANAFEQKLSELDTTAVVMCSVETQE